MIENLVKYEAQIRLLFFFGTLLIMALWEGLRPCRNPRFSKVSRWFNNLSLVVISSIAVRILFPIAALGFAILAGERGWGVLNQLQGPAWLEFLIAILLLDLVIYFQHRAFHALPLLWRLHRVHHADPDFDTTTGLRFHPVEIILSMLIKCATVLALGPSAGAVIAFEVLLNASALFNHGNVRLPPRLDRYLRWIIVTPDMHRVHHSTLDDELNSNFGFNLPWWDRVFCTYIAQPRAGHQSMAIGLEGIEKPAWTIHVLGLLTLPFVNNPTAFRDPPTQD